jgi:hypothetical protein
MAWGVPPSDLATCQIQTPVPINGSVPAPGVWAAAGPVMAITATIAAASARGMRRRTDGTPESSQLCWKEPQR